MNLLHSIFKHIIDTLFPKRCIVCQKIGKFLCIECVATLPRASVPKQPFISALFDYRHASVKAIIWRFKYANIRDLSETLGESMYEDIVGTLGEQFDITRSKTFLIVPIPLHLKRLRERGYNQSELLAQAIIANDAENLFTISLTSLDRVRETRPQAKKDKRAARFQNLHKAFRASESEVRGKNILLIDDVTTTGATLCEARDALKAAGANSVLAYTVAH